MLYKLVVGTEPEARRHRNKSIAPQRLDKSGIHSRQVADESKPALHFVMHHGVSRKTLRVRRRNSHGRLALGGNCRGHFLVQQSGEDHHRHISRLAVGHAQSADKFALDAHALQRGGEKPSAPVNHQDLVAILGQRGHLARQSAYRGVVFQ